MNRTDVASLAFRLLGIWFLILAIVALCQLLALLLVEESRPPDGSFLWTFLAAPIVYGAGSWFLLARADALARRLYPPPTAAPPPATDGPEAWLAVALAGFGFWQLTLGVPELVNALAENPPTSLAGPAWTRQPLLPVAARLVLGILLVLGGRAIARWWARPAPAA
ncbi:MAG: hypothetical protein D6702_06765 [Planctomycetota bacterium]|nr:MAG: hypothetical protein D6702_06765 [Planctomycetota bacterium]